ncbi:class I SAM-dependent methyltransferase [Virgisporangium aurantiacum]|uniref:Nicotinamide N-methylase n=1 Tax=Virgisporangium aurantiacum TaxID=175570 RepID=A0A8J3ZK08_9ACTN|nr:50S ribosomal protein L11 methyltransferase [Virgisporangium aurantiacum]GIJ62931.1 nicotinamide N-methylase [Virgisporangium aurantiacum]
MAGFVQEHTTIRRASAVPEIVLHQADDAIGLWERTERAAGGHLPPPFWAFAWAGGQAVARYVLDHPEIVRNRRVLDLAAGGGVVAIAAARAGASEVTATEIDPAALDALALNAAANGVTVTARLGDVLDAPEDDSELHADVVTAGDVFYNRELSARMMAFLRRAAERGAVVLAGDPGRAYAPTGLRAVARYEIPTTHDLESVETKLSTVWQLERQDRANPADTEE